jgi:hypothetical protein
MIVKTPSGRAWELRDIGRKLSDRARLPGARVFDLSADALRIAKAKGVPDDGRLAMALPGSWLVNSPAVSTVIRRWALPPDREVILDTLALFDPPSLDPLDDAAATRLEQAVASLGKEPNLVEALSKVLALLVPHAIPLMPPLAVAHVLGEGVVSDAKAFVGITRWFGEAVAEHWDGLTAEAAKHAEVPLDAAQVLDRLLWFDSDGFKHFAWSKGAAAGGI